MSDTKQDWLRALLDGNGWKYFDELNGFRKESIFTIPMFSTDQEKSYDSISDGNFRKLEQAIAKQIEKEVVEARIDERTQAQQFLHGLTIIPENRHIFDVLSSDNHKSLTQLKDISTKLGEK